MTTLASDIQGHWAAVGPILSIEGEHGYDAAVELLNTLIDEVGTDENHHLYSLLDTLGIVISAYEDANHPVPDASGTDALRYLMEEHGLTQSQLPEVGSQGVVSEVLSGKRELNLRQVRGLAERFGVSTALFV